MFTNGRHISSKGAKNRHENCSILGPPSPYYESQDNYFFEHSLKLRENWDAKRKGCQSQRATLCDDTPRLRREELHKVHFDKSATVSVRIVKGACTSGAARDTPS